MSGLFRRPKRPSHAIDMAPLIDVVFLLLIFFMLTSAFREPSLPLNLPSATGSPETPTEALVISVDAAGTIAIADRAVTLDAFSETLRATLDQRKNRTVNFRGDHTVDYGVFVDLMDRARQSGASQFNLIHDPRPVGE
ncbi:MAG: biopolymer transporter ExbD [Chthoniobacterales bacterium]